MRRVAGYRAAVEWIAMNDEDDDDHADVEAVAEMVTVALVADVWQVSASVVAADVLEARERWSS